MKRKVQVVILNESEDHSIEILVFKTNRERGSFWQNVTGSVEHNENFDQAAIRELIEETGIDRKLAKKSIKTLESEFFFTDRKDRKVQEKVYYCLVPKWDVIMCDEHTKFKWMDPQEIPRDFYKYESNYQAMSKALIALENE